ncbi:hypothetical protein [Helicobacter kayseriensis]|uniref:hypothetical protein n=1 Tax=Helicobacter kayseriensis TaxID=2905877 RepID=UPI001E406AD1|nr:hypothetical protein [Helicobacter kayseriensis]MCE3046660.1 hypothetical protein [Helicobacter kayseriensis]MCE3048038.1 hypothetical protein [Helicobacter kayseriensis]
MISCKDLTILQKYGYINCSSIDNVVFLKTSQEELWRQLRKSYKPLINSFLKNPDFKVEIYDANNPSYEMHQTYVEYHHLCSRRKTRSDESFEIQYDFLLEGFTSLFVLRYQAEPIGCCYFFHNNSSVFYHSGSDLPKYEGSKIPIYHIILYHAFLHFSQMGYTTICLSQPANFLEIQGFLDYCDQKQINIAHFKRGMGGQAVPLMRGIKYFNHNHLKEEIQNFYSEIK